MRSVRLAIRPWTDEEGRNLATVAAALLLFLGGHQSCHIKWSPGTTFVSFSSWTINDENPSVVISPFLKWLVTHFGYFPCLRRQWRSVRIPVNHESDLHHRSWLNTETEVRVEGLNHYFSKCFFFFCPSHQLVHFHSSTSFKVYFHEKEILFIILFFSRLLPALAIVSMSISGPFLLFFPFPKTFVVAGWSLWATGTGFYNPNKLLKSNSNRRALYFHSCCANSKDLVMWRSLGETNKHFNFMRVQRIPRTVTSSRNSFCSNSAPPFLSSRKNYFQYKSS